MSTSHTSSNETQENRRRKRTVVKFSLAGIALLGIGAAVTSAAWTDDAWFTADAKAATIELQGSLDGSTWTDADALSGAVTIPVATFDNLVPGEDRVVTVHLRNSGQVPLEVTESSLTTSGALFTGSAAASADTDWSTDVIDAGDTAEVDLTVSTPPTWPDTYQGSTGTVTVTFTGTTE